MTRHVLILGNNLAGLITAYRLSHYGFHISIVDTQGPTQSIDHSRTSPESIHSTSSPSLSESEEIPLILHGFYHATWAFLQEVSFEWPPQTTQSVCLEFGTEGRKPFALAKISRLWQLHSFTRFIFFKGLSWSDRWNIINFLEKQWEDNRLSNHHSDTEDVEAWLISAKQSVHSRSHFWNPLCRFFLNCDLPQASLSSFIAVLSQYWFGQPTDAATFLAPPQTLGKLETELRQFLINKGVRFYLSKSKVNIKIDSAGIQAVELDEKHFKAQAYISTLAPLNLLSLLPERALARYAYFSSLAHIPEVYGLAVQFTLLDSLIGHRVILNSHPFDWITSQTNEKSDSPKTLITCITLCESLTQEHTEEWLFDTAWLRIQNLFNISPTHTQESSKPRIFRQAGPFFPSHRGCRAHRPLPQTPILNLFVAGAWTATNLPLSLESTIKSANGCAESVATAFYGRVH